MSQTDKQIIGQIGENCAVTYLNRHGYRVIERNYRKKYGEIDIIATKGQDLHFIEVKSVTHSAPEAGPLGARGPASKVFSVFSRESLSAGKHRVSWSPTPDVEEPTDDDDTASVEDYGESQYEAEENVHPWKLKRLRRTIEAYLLSRYPDDDDEEPDWQLDVITVSVDMNKHIGSVKILEDIDIC